MAKYLFIWDMFNTTGHIKFSVGGRPLGWLSWLSVQLQLGSWSHGFEPRVRLCADSSEPGTCFGSSVPFSLSVPPLLMLSLSFSLSKINKH